MHSISTWRYLPAILMVLALHGSLVWQPATAVAAGSILCVSAAGGRTSPPCSNGTAYTSIQDAVDSATSGAEIRIAGGTYRRNGIGVPVVNISGKSLTLRGGYSSASWAAPSSANQTILDGQDKFSVVQILYASVGFERLTITRGNRTGDSGGGINANLLTGQSVVLDSVLVTNNRARSSGGGVFVVGSSTIVTNSVFSNNHAEGLDGGAFYGYRLEASGSRFVGNTAKQNAGGAGADTAVIRGCLFSGNSTLEGGGGAIYAYAGLELLESQILDNTAGGIGGAIYAAYPAQLTVRHTVLGNNRASQNVDGIFSADRGQSRTDIKLTNVTIASAAPTSHMAIFLQLTPDSVEISNSIIANHAIGISRQSSLPLSGDYNTFYQNGQDQLVADQAEPLSFTHMVNSDPLFVDPVAGNFRLQAGSPLINAGDPTRSYVDQFDIDGGRVPQQGQPDIGASEFLPFTDFTYMPQVGS